MNINIFQDVQTLLQVSYVCRAMVRNIDRLESEGESNVQTRAEAIFSTIRTQVSNTAYTLNYTHGEEADTRAELVAFADAIDNLINEIRAFTEGSART